MDTYRILIKKQYILLAVWMIISFFIWSSGIFWPGGDSAVYFNDAKIAVNSLTERDVVDFYDVFRYLDGDVFFNEKEHYTNISIFINYLTNTSFGIIFFQTFLAYFTFQSMQKIIRFYLPCYRQTWNVYQIILITPFFLIATVPLKECITVFLITYSFKLHLYSNLKAFLIVIFILFIYRWQFLLILIGMMFFYNASKYMLTHFRTRIFLAFLTVSIVFTTIVSFYGVEYAQIGYSHPTLKMFVSAFAFPLLKVNVFNVLEPQHMLMMAWNNIYSILWYFFLPAFFISLFKSSVEIKSLSLALLMVLIIFGIISGGMVSDRFKFGFFPIYLAIGVVGFYNSNRKKYLSYFLLLMFLNFSQATYHYSKKNIFLSSIYFTDPVNKNLIV